MIFWKHIKGLSNKNIYSYIRFSEEENAGVNTKMISLPLIYLSNSTNFDNTGSVGHLLTSEMTEGYIKEIFTFKNNVIFQNNENNTQQLKIWFNASQWKLESDQLISITNDCYFNGHATITNTDDINITSNPVTGGAFIVEGGVRINKKLYVKKELRVDNKAEALYFNAISDYRAKKDFKLLDIDALELIKKVQLYSFKYKESNQSSIGIIAQDVQDININGFELVDNKEASGANFDYMSIHESKLVYILWKAIQEQQKEIEELKKLIK